VLGIPSDGIEHAALSPEGRWVVFGREDGSIVLAPIERLHESIALGRTGNKRLYTLRFSRDGRLLMAHWQNNRHRMWQLSDAEPKLLFDERRSDVLDANGARLVIALQSHLNPEIRATALDSKRAWERRFAEIDSPCFARFNPTGDWLLLGSAQKLTCWHPESDHRVTTDQSLPISRLCCAFARDNKTFAIAFDHQALIGRVGDSRINAVIRGHHGRIHTVAFSSDGRFLATGGDDRIIRVWHLPTAQEVLSLEGHHHPIHGLQFAGNGSGLYSLSLGDVTAELFFWPAPP